jgi:hypothetical protein
MLRSRYAYAVAFSCLGAVVLAAIARNADWIWTVLLSWLAADFWLVALAYVLRWNTIFGKTAAGSIRMSRAVMMMPYLAMTWVVWRLQHWLVREPIWNEVREGLFVGRRCRLRQLPPGTSTVVDFTAEFMGDKASRSEFEMAERPGSGWLRSRFDWLRISLQLS